jgi:hypothetical protein
MISNEWSYCGVTAIGQTLLLTVKETPKSAGAHRALSQKEKDWMMFRK